MKVTVTEKHIYDGEPKTECRCPVALAIKQQCPERSVHVSKLSVYIVGPIILFGEIPIRVTDIIQKYDCYGTMDPFSFEIELDIIPSL